MLSPLVILAAGSLRSAFTPLLAEFNTNSQQQMTVNYGPAGLLRQRIEAGEPCSLFASANSEHPQRLHTLGLASTVVPFARNQLCLTTRRTAQTENASWLELLGNPELVIGTSTPGCDPSGDYAWHLFDKVAALLPATAGHLKQRAVPLVGGPVAPPIPAGELAAAWLIHQRLADIFIGYAHYAGRLEQDPLLRVVRIPDEYNIMATYTLAVRSAAAMGLAEFILSPRGQYFLRAAGFLALDHERKKI